MQYHLPAGNGLVGQPVGLGNALNVVGRVVGRIALEPSQPQELRAEPE